MPLRMLAPQWQDKETQQQCRVFSGECLYGDLISFPTPLPLHVLGCILLLLLLPTPTLTLAPGPHPPYDPLCVSNAPAVPAPWDCRGYIRCELFDVDTLACVSRPNEDVANFCGTRPVPATPCDYRLGCTPGSRCQGLVDGNYADLSRPFSPHYVTCQHEQVARESKCDKAGQIFDPTARQCNFGIRDGSVSAFCNGYPTAVFPDPYHCARHFNCSQVTWHTNLRAKQSECRYPLLFDVTTMACARFDVVSCGTRQEPIQPCDYMTGHCQGRNQCIPCQASCLGLPDGYNAYPGYVLTPYHILCHAGRTMDIRNCSQGLVFDPQMRVCSPDISVQTLDLFCSENPNGKLAHPSECSLLYDCTRLTARPNFPKYLSECKYPYLVDAATVQCKPHDQVTCGDRREPISPCDYQGYKCTTSNCKSCELVMPSCYGKLNGFYPVINQEMTSTYMECRDQRVVALSSCPGGLIFDILDRKCVETISKESMLRYCTNFLTGRVQNPANCAQYYDCTQNLTNVQECRYPDLYHVASQQCRPYKEVECKGRQLFLDPCDSFTFCPVTPCPYCPTAFPTCIGRNGAVSGFLFDSSLYQRCIDNRMVLGRCAGTFDAVAKACRPPYNDYNANHHHHHHHHDHHDNNHDSSNHHNNHNYDNHDTFNDDHHHHQENYYHPTGDNCAQYYNCSNPTSSLGRYVSECPMGQLFHAATGMCAPRHMVQCQGRPAPQQACHYKANQCPHAGTSTGCVPCRDRFPSCWGRRHGPVPLPRQLSPVYVTCYRGRVTGLHRCPPGLFMDPSYRRCTSQLTRNTTLHFCLRHPNTRLSHPLHCGRYIVCRQPGTAPLERECPYPQLVSSGHCRPFQHVRCGARYEPKVPCDYASLRKCPDHQKAGCPACEKRYPSCGGQPDGDRPYPGRLLSPWFVKCRAERTMAIVRCVRSVFDPVTNTCGRSLDQILDTVASNPASLCQRQPQAVVPDPGHCARFYNCSQRAPGLLGRPYLSECRFPSLFNRRTGRCDSFLNVARGAGCGRSKEPLHQCEYSSYCPGTRYRTCRDCYSHIPSCRRVPDGIHTIPPGRRVSRAFVYCLDQRSLVFSQCPPGFLYYDTAKTCVTRNSASIPPFILAAVTEPPEV
ncbi:uncharacterized protein LOC143288755 [Babylonia areolata]|uniref:uncharacterized protein LOC143288755 n=1 Tax=Babylonia areolata TaxID=304850 RepID=UPI003FD16C4A